MPPQKVRLHNTSGKHKIIKNARPQPQPSTSSQLTTTNEIDTQAELELCWCIQQLETNLNSGKLNEKQLQDCLKHIKLLKSNTQPIIKKRQLMRTLFGDYRAKMAEEERKLYQANKNVTFSTHPQPSKNSYFVKKSALLTLGNNENFNFGFDIENRLNELQIDEKEINGTITVDADKPQTPVSLAVAPDLLEGKNFRFNFNIPYDNDNDK